MRKKILVDALVLLGIAVNVALLLINLRPERPHLAPHTKAKILLRASPPRVAWMNENEFSEFGKANDVDFEFIHAKDFDEATEILIKEKTHPTGIVLADVDDEYSDSLIQEGALRPMQDVAPPLELAAALDEYIPESVERAKSGGKVWFVPKRAVVNISIFLKPAVEEAYLEWEKDRPGIEAALKEANGYGLPKNFTLKRSPEAWDTYDLFVSAWYWAHHPATWAEVQNTDTFDGPPAPTTLPRVAFPTGDNQDAINRVVERFYQHGLKDEDLGKLDAPAILDALQWDALFHKHHLVASQAEGKDGLDTFGVNALMKKRLIAWAPIDQADSLWVHGGARRDAERGIRHARDLGWATLPRGVSLELGKNGEPARQAKSFAFEEVNFWGVPVHSPHPLLAWQLARFLTQRGLQLRETEAEGMLPIRKDLATDYPILFRLVWMQQILDASYRQLAKGTGDMPDDIEDKGYGTLYAKLREHVVTGGGGKVDLASIRAAVGTFKPPPPEAQHGQ